MNKVLLTLSIMVLSGSLLAKENPTTPKAARVQISPSPEIDLAKEHLTIISSRTNNIGDSPRHFGVVHYAVLPVVTTTSPAWDAPSGFKFRNSPGPAGS